MATAHHPGRLRVLVIEDRPIAAAALQAGLHQAGMAIDLAQNGAEAMQRKASFLPDIVLLDLDLPDIKEHDLLHRLGADSCGLIVLADDGEQGARIASQQDGADDYMVKPIRPRELAARIRALHRRKGHAPAPVMLTIDRAARTLTGRAGQPTLLTAAELAVLETLLDAEGASVSREWAGRIAHQAGDSGVDELILRLRRALVAQGASGRILSARDHGYVIADSTLFRFTP